MPFPHAPRARTGPRRRSLFAVVPTALLAAGCSAGSRDAGPADGGPPPPPASERARARAARDSRELAERYDAVIAAHAGLARRLGPLRENAVRHAKAFEGLGTAAGPEAAAPEPSTSPTPAGAAPSASPSGPVPAEEDALSGLAAVEREVADRRLEALLDAPPELARLLASVAAAGAAHVFLLTEG